MLGRILLFFVLILNCSMAFGEGTDEPGEFTERILLFRTVAGDKLFDGLYAHELDRTLYLSSVDVFETLGFKTDLSLDSKVFKATTLSPELDLVLKWEDCEFFLNKKKFKFPCAKFKIFEDELFLTKDLVEKILDAKIEYLPYKSEIRIATDVLYPILSRLKRKSKKINASPRGDFDPGFKRTKIESQTLKNVFLDQQFTYTKQSERDGLFQYYSNLTTDVAQHEIQVTTQGDDDSSDFTTWQIKRDFYGAQKNKFVSTYQFGNIVTPSAEIIGGPGSGEGFYITNRQQFLINFGQREFEGNLRPDWEVELYVNDTLFERQSANTQGRYRFQNVPVQYGVNNFRLEFYGPLGERKTEYINNDVSQSSLTKGRLRYEAGVSNDESGETESLVQTSYGLRDNLSLYLAYTRYNLFNDGEIRDYAVTGLNGYSTNTNYSVFRGQDFFNRGDFNAIRTQFNIRNSRLQLLYLDAENFRSNNISSRTKFLDKRYMANLNTNLFGRMSLLYRFEHDLFEDETKETRAIQNIVFPLWKLTLLFENDLVDGQSNKLDIIYTHLRNQYRARMVYNWDEVETYNFEFRNRFKRESSVSLAYDKSILEQTDFFRAGYQQRFHRFFLGFEVSSDFDNEHLVLARIRSSFGHTPSQKKIQMSSDMLASRGNVCSKIYYDLNENNKFEEQTDRPAKNVDLRWVQGNFDFKSDKKGRVFLSNLPLYTPVDVQLLTKTLEDPQMSPVEEGYRLYLQRGQCSEANFLLRRVYDFEGQVFAEGALAKKRQTIVLTDAYGKTLKETRTDKEGYFLFESLPSNVYYMKLKDISLKTEPEMYIINPFNMESLDQDFYFDVSN